jgi:hypothetical protein
VPCSVYQQHHEEIDTAIANIADNGNNKNESPLNRRIRRLKSLLIIKNKSVSVPFFYLKEKGWKYLNRDYKIIAADIKYDFELGAEVTSQQSYDNAI